MQIRQKQYNLIFLITFLILFAMFVSRQISSLQIKALFHQSKILTQFAPTLQATQFYGTKDSYSNHEFDGHKRKFFKIACIIGFGSSFAIWSHKQIAEAKSAENTAAEDLSSYGKRIEGLKEYTSKDVAKHDTVKKRVWVTFKNGVYDVTDFINEHPGGEQNILLGAGNSVEPFWASYAVHYSSNVLEKLEKLRIGNLAKDDVGTDMTNMGDPFENEPKRNPTLKQLSSQPFNAEPPPPLLVENLHTPNDIFYVRNHLPVPDIKEDCYELEIDGLGIEATTLKLEDIKKFPKRTISAAVQCGGNRRSEMIKIKSVKGLSWTTSAIGNAEWSGARLCDVLHAAGVRPNTEALHVQFEGLDLDTTGSPYGASIPIEKAIDLKGDVLLAYEMNGVPIPRDHGYPIRLVVPGVVGARNVKWLGRIIVSKKESSSHWQQNDYKTFAPNVDYNTVNFSKSPAIQDMPVTSAICTPQEGDVVNAKHNKIEVQGYSYSGGGRKTVRVDISTDGGKTWQEVDELISDNAKHPQAWGWTLWKAQITVPKGSSKLELAVKAVDSSQNTQPESFENIWNLRGLVGNAYHRVNVEVKN